jgi:hypothetical protein
MVGICLIRLRNIRPRLFPAWLAISSENAAHRAAVEWDEGGMRREGVYVRRRDTNSWTNSVAGGRLFPGTHHHATFEVQETRQDFQIAVSSDDGATHMSMRAHSTDRLPASSIFQSVDEASAFFQAGSVGYSPTSDPSRFQGLELRCLNWQVEPLAVEDVQSSFFDDVSLFPSGSIEFDSALLMRGIDHEWHSQPDLCCAVTIGPPPVSPI